MLKWTFHSHESNTVHFGLKVSMISDFTISPPNQPHVKGDVLWPIFINEITSQVS